MPNKLNTQDKLTLLIRQKGINTWPELLNFVQALPYGRTSDRADLSLVIREGHGTCSSKHALLKKVADLNGLSNIQLILGMYKMNHSNTPKIGSVLLDNNLDYIPEAHCYLKINGKRLDITNTQSDIATLKDAIIEELEIQPEQVNEFKVSYHQNYLKQWIVATKSDKKFDELWRIREQCIANLSV